MISASNLQLDRHPDVTAVAEGDMPQPSTEVDTAHDFQDEAYNEAYKHPLGVRPSGNAWTSSANAQDAMGAFARLPDALLLGFLESLDQPSLAALGSTCRGLFAFCSFDQLWRDRAIGAKMNHFAWRGSWRASLRKLPSAQLPVIDCTALFSDELHRPFLCSQLSLSRFVSDIPHVNRIARFDNLTVSDFNESWSHRPFILTQPVKQWPVYEKWCQDDLARKYGDTVFRAEAVDWPLKEYLNYMSSTQDESPLYLFDRAFVEKMGLEVGGPRGAYQPPDCFEEDLFTLLGDDRPDHRWLIIGPARSGSTFHKDPNATSAWNAVIRGSKYWIMFPNTVLPPGVYVSEDQSEVTSPLSIAEWMLAFHAEARETPGCIEGICHEGEVLHVPSGWWHLVVNLDPAIAITQNFVPRSHLGAAASFLKNKASQVSGFRDEVRDPFELFMKRLREEHPELADSLGEAGTKKRKWEEIVHETDDGDEKRGGFSFGFGDDIDEDEA